MSAPGPRRASRTRTLNKQVRQTCVPINQKQKQKTHNSITDTDKKSLESDCCGQTFEHTWHCWKKVSLMEKVNTCAKESNAKQWVTQEDAVIFGRAQTHELSLQRTLLFAFSGMGEISKVHSAFCVVQCDFCVCRTLSTHVCFKIL